VARDLPARCRQPECATDAGGNLHGSGRFDDPADRERVALPRLRLGAQSRATAGGERVVLGAAIVVGESPLRYDRAAFLEAVERFIECSVDDHELAFAAAFDPFGNGVAMHGAP